MKKSLLVVLLAIALVSPVFAAEKDMWVGGSFGYTSSNFKIESPGGENTASSTAWSIEPEFGWTIVDRWDIGLDFAYTSGAGVKNVYGVDIPWDIQPDFTGMEIAPFARYYLAKVAGVDIILKASIFYGKGECKYYGNKVDCNAYGISIAPIISYSINETWSIGAKLNFAELSYTHVEFDEDHGYYSVKPKCDNFGFNLNNGSLISVGFSYHF